MDFQGKTLSANVFLEFFSFPIGNFYTSFWLLFSNIMSSILMVGSWLFYG